MSDENVVGRDEFQRMLRDAEDGRFDCLLVWEIDRFGRERQDIPTGKMTLKRAGVKPHIDLLQYQRKRTALACSSAVQMSWRTTVDFSVLSAKQLYSCYITAARASISSHHTSNTLLAVGSTSAKCASKCCLFKR